MCIRHIRFAWGSERSKMFLSERKRFIKLIHPVCMLAMHPSLLCKVNRELPDLNTIFYTRLKKVIG